MKKMAILSMLVFASGIAGAQSSVTLFGTIDETFAMGRGSVANKTQLTTSGYNSSRFGVSGREDLGGGVMATFWLEAGVGVDSGVGVATNTNNQTTGAAPPSPNQGVVFNRRSTASLLGQWGEVRLGRDITTQFYNIGEFDPFGTNGVGATQILSSSLGGPVNVRASNAITYFLPSNIGGAYGAAQYYLGENLSNAGSIRKDGAGGGILAGFASGPFKAGIAYSSTQYATGNIRQANLGGFWDFGAVKVFGQYEDDRVSAPLSVNGKGWLVGSHIPVGVGQFRMSYSAYRTSLPGKPTTDKWALGYVHNLSKRTAIYGTYARLGNKGGAAQALNASVTATNQDSSGLNLGFRHNF